MRLINTEHIKTGMKVGRNIYSPHGVSFVRKGDTLNHMSIEKILEHKVPAIVIDDEMSKGIKINEIVDSGYRSLLVFKLKSIFERIHKSEVHKYGGAIFLNTEKKMILRIVDELINQILINSDRHYIVMDTMCLDLSLYQHSINTAILSIKTGIRLRYPRRQLRQIGLGALLHDIGKLMIPKEILNKPEKLNVDEFEIVKKHSLLGYTLIKNEDWIDDVAKDIILKHHERLDGSGYPIGLADAHLSAYVRIVAIADVFDAMVCNRIYRNRIPICKCIEMMRSDARSKLDPYLFNIFIEDLFVYPPGCGVLLNTGERCMVTEASVGFEIMRPKMKLIRDDSNHRITYFKEIDLSLHHSLNVVELCEI